MRMDRGFSYLLGLVSLFMAGLAFANPPGPSAQVHHVGGAPVGNPGFHDPRFQNPQHVQGGQPAAPGPIYGPAFQQPRGPINPAPIVQQQPRGPVVVQQQPRGPITSGPIIHQEPRGPIQTGPVYQHVPVGGPVVQQQPRGPIQTGPVYQHGPVGGPAIQQTHGPIAGAGAIGGIQHFNPPAARPVIHATPYAPINRAEFVGRPLNWQYPHTPVNVHYAGNYYANYYRSYPMMNQHIVALGTPYYNAQHVLFTQHLHVYGGYYAAPGTPFYRLYEPLYGVGFFGGYRYYVRPCVDVHFQLNIQTYFGYPIVNWFFVDQPVPNFFATYYGGPVFQQYPVRPFPFVGALFQTDVIRDLGIEISGLSPDKQFVFRESFGGFLMQLQTQIRMNIPGFRFAPQSVVINHYLNLRNTGIVVEGFVQGPNPNQPFRAFKAWIDLNNMAWTQTVAPAGPNLSVMERQTLNEINRSMTNLGVNPLVFTPEPQPVVQGGQIGPTYQPTLPQGFEPSQILPTDGQQPQYTPVQGQPAPGGIQPGQLNPTYQQPGGIQPGQYQQPGVGIQPDQQNPDYQQPGQYQQPGVIQQPGGVQQPGAQQPGQQQQLPQPVVPYTPPTVSPQQTTQPSGQPVQSPTAPATGAYGQPGPYTPSTPTYNPVGGAQQPTAPVQPQQPTTLPQPPPPQPPKRSDQG